MWVCWKFEKRTQIETEISFFLFPFFRTLNMPRKSNSFQLSYCQHFPLKFKYFIDCVCFTGTTFPRNLDLRQKTILTVNGLFKKHMIAQNRPTRSSERNWKRSNLSVWKVSEFWKLTSIALKTCTRSQS